MLSGAKLPCVICFDASIVIGIAKACEISFLTSEFSSCGCELAPLWFPREKPARKSVRSSFGSIGCSGIVTPLSSDC